MDVMHDQHSDFEWLKLTCMATDVQDLEQCRLTIKDGVLIGLNLCSRQLRLLPGSIGNFTSLTTLCLDNNRLGSLPESIGQLKLLTQLFLSNNRLGSLPESIGQLKLLTQLFLSNNRLGSLPESIGQFTLLTELNLGNNLVSCLPKGIGQLALLTKLWLRNNQLTVLPESIGQLHLLTYIDLTKNYLASLPETFWQLTTLTSLLLDNNQLASLPESIGQLTLLSELDLFNNQLASLPESIGQLSLLTGLNISNNQLTYVPQNIRQLTKMAWLDLGNNQLASLPEDIGRFTKLTHLDLGFNKISSFPESVQESIGQLTSLTKLNLGSNQLTSLPESIGQLTLLTELYLYRNQLATLPDSISKLTLLMRLDLSCNKFSSVTDVVCPLNLTELHLGCNHFASLPASIEKLTKLTRLFLGSNQLQGEVPQWLGQLVSLEELDLSGNDNLCGSLPSMTCPNIHTNGTKISSVTIKTKPIKNLFDWLFVVAHMLMGYADLATDVLAIIEFGNDGNAALMWLNIGFLLFNLCVDVWLMPDAWGRVLVLLQVQQAVQAYESLASGWQTGNFVRSKKVDAVCRSVPSIVLQLYGLLATLPNLRFSGIMTISLSVAFGVAGSAMTLGSLAPKSGESLLSYAFGVHFCYYVCELTVRLLSMSLLFVSIGSFALAVLGADFFYRTCMIIKKSSDARLLGNNLMSDILVYARAITVDTLMSALLVFGSDAIDGPSPHSLIIWSTLSSVVLILSLSLMNLLNTPTLAALRTANGVKAVTELACVALFFKYTVGNYVKKMKFANTEALLKQDEKQRGEEGQINGKRALPPLLPRASQSVSLDATYDGSQVDHIPPSRLHAQHAGPGSASLAAGRGSSGAMTDNPLRPGTGGGAAPGSLQHVADCV